MKNSKIFWKLRIVAVFFKWKNKNILKIEKLKLALPTGGFVMQSEERAKPGQAAPVDRNDDHDDDDGDGDGVGDGDDSDGDGFFAVFSLRIWVHLSHQISKLNQQWFFTQPHNSRYFHAFSAFVLFLSAKSHQDRIRLKHNLGTEKLHFFLTFCCFGLCSFISSPLDCFSLT